MAKATVTLNLGEEDSATLTRLAKQDQATKTAILRHAIRLYRVLKDRKSKGDRFFCEAPDGKRFEIIVL